MNDTLHSILWIISLGVLLILLGIGLMMWRRKMHHNSSQASEKSQSAALKRSEKHAAKIAVRNMRLERKARIKSIRGSMREFQKALYLHQKMSLRDQHQRLQKTLWYWVIGKARSGKTTWIENLGESWARCPRKLSEGEDAMCWYVGDRLVFWEVPEAYLVQADHLGGICLKQWMKYWRKAMGRLGWSGVIWVVDSEALENQKLCEFEESALRWLGSLRSIWPSPIGVDHVISHMDRAESFKSWSLTVSRQVLSEVFGVAPRAENHREISVSHQVDRQKRRVIDFESAWKPFHQRLRDEALQGMSYCEAYQARDTYFFSQTLHEWAEPLWVKRVRCETISLQGVYFCGWQSEVNVWISGLTRDRLTSKSIVIEPKRERRYRWNQQIIKVGCVALGIAGVFVVGFSCHSSVLSLNQLNRSLQVTGLSRSEALPGVLSCPQRLLLIKAIESGAGGQDVFRSWMWPMVRFSVANPLIELRLQWARVCLVPLLVKQAQTTLADALRVVKQHPTMNNWVSLYDHMKVVEILTGMISSKPVSIDSDQRSKVLLQWIREQDPTLAGEGVLSDRVQEISRDGVIMSRGLQHVWEDSVKQMSKIPLGELAYGVWKSRVPSVIWDQHMQRMLDDSYAAHQLYHLNGQGVSLVWSLEGKHKYFDAPAKPVLDELKNDAWPMFGRRHPFSYHAIMDAWAWMQSTYAQEKRDVWLSAIKHVSGVHLESLSQSMAVFQVLSERSSPMNIWMDRLAKESDSKGVLRSWLNSNAHQRENDFFAKYSKSSTKASRVAVVTAATGMVNFLEALENASRPHLAAYDIAQKLLQGQPVPALDAMRQAARELPYPFDHQLNTWVLSTELLVFASAKHYLDESWRGSVLSQYDALLSRGSPIILGADESPSVAEFEYFFGHRGTVASFRKKYLEGFLRRDGSGRFEWALFEGQPIWIDTRWLAQLNSAHDVATGLLSHEDSIHFEWHLRCPMTLSCLDVSWVSQGHQVLNFEGAPVIWSMDQASFQAFGRGSVVYRTSWLHRDVRVRYPGRWGLVEWLLSAEPHPEQCNQGLLLQKDIGGEHRGLCIQWGDGMGMMAWHALIAMHRTWGA